MLLYAMLSLMLILLGQRIVCHLLFPEKLDKISTCEVIIVQQGYYFNESYIFTYLRINQVTYIISRK